MPYQSLIAARNCLRRLLSNTEGQDMIEYALLSGMMVLALWATFPTGVVPSISAIFSRIVSTASATP